MRQFCIWDAVHPGCAGIEVVQGLLPLLVRFPLPAQQEVNENLEACCAYPAHIRRISG